MRIGWAVAGMLGLAACAEMAPVSVPGAAPGGGAAPATSSDPAALLPFGEPATICGVSEAALGTPVETRGRYVLRDSAPGSTALRPHYITGLEDGCAVQFSAALALLGDILTHETVRYNPSNTAPYTMTDMSYEQVKAQICRVAQGEPCGDRTDTLGSRAAFVTAYATFGDSRNWYELFLFDGGLMAVGADDS